MLKTVGFPSTRTGDQTIVDGDLVIGTAGKGIDFSANGGDVLTQYDENTWTPVLAAGVGAIGSTGSATGKYIRVGNAVTLYFTITITNNGTSSGYLRLTGMPFAFVGSNLAFGAGAETGVSSKALTMYQNSATEMIVLFADGTYPGATNAIIGGVIQYSLV